jgi:DNA-binding NtrC family response regulator
MNNIQRLVCLIDGDPLVMEGMKLLLHDLQCEVSILRRPKTTQELILTPSACPKLIITPDRLETGIAGQDLIQRIRTQCTLDIPAIILCTDTDFGTTTRDTDRLVFLPDNVNPQRLREVISNLLDLPTTR